MPNQTTDSPPAWSTATTAWPPNWSRRPTCEAGSCCIGLRKFSITTPDGYSNVAAAAMQILAAAVTELAAIRVRKRL